MVTSTLLDRRPLFNNWKLGRLLVSEFRQVQELELAESLAWVVMPDHFHWLFALRKGSLGKLVQRVKSKSSIAINKAQGLNGSIWQDGYHDMAVRREEEILGLARYIVANPLRAGLVNRLGDYPLWDAVWLTGAKDIDKPYLPSRASSLPQDQS
jgi:REP element-mobilizing transposase RayT